MADLVVQPQVSLVKGDFNRFLSFVGYRYQLANADYDLRSPFVSEFGLMLQTQQGLLAKNPIRIAISENLDPSDDAECIVLAHGVTGTLSFVRRVVKSLEENVFQFLCNNPRYIGLENSTADSFSKPVVRRAFCALAKTQSPIVRALVINALELGLRVRQNVRDIPRSLGDIQVPNPLDVHVSLLGQHAGAESFGCVAPSMWSVDIVLIHSLHGPAEFVFGPLPEGILDTTTSAAFESIGDGVSSASLSRTWPTMLPYCIHTADPSTMPPPTAFRVINLRHNVDVFTKMNSTMRQCLDDFASILTSCKVGEQNRTVLFVAHHIGGILLKQVLPRWENAKNTGGIVFLDVPHFGLPITLTSLSFVNANAADLLNNREQLQKIDSHFKEFVAGHQRSIGSLPENTLPVLDCVTRPPILPSSQTTSALDDGGAASSVETPSSAWYAGSQRNFTVSTQHLALMKDHLVACLRASGAAHLMKLQLDELAALVLQKSPPVPQPSSEPEMWSIVPDESWRAVSALVIFARRDQHEAFQTMISGLSISDCRVIQTRVSHLPAFLKRLTSQWEAIKNEFLLVRAKDWLKAVFSPWAGQQRETSFDMSLLVPERQPNFLIALIGDPTGKLLSTSVCRNVVRAFKDLSVPIHSVILPCAGFENAGHQLELKRVVDSEACHFLTMCNQESPGDVVLEGLRHLLPKWRFLLSGVAYSLTMTLQEKFANEPYLVSFLLERKFFQNWVASIFDDLADVGISGRMVCTSRFEDETRLLMLHLLASQEVGALSSRKMQSIMPLLACELPRWIYNHTPDALRDCLIPPVRSDVVNTQRITQAELASFRQRIRESLLHEFDDQKQIHSE
eukprot:ANDGO_00357.mRNA.1 hypothetical protein